MSQALPHERAACLGICLQSISQHHIMGTLYTATSCIAVCGSAQVASVNLNDRNVAEVTCREIPVKDVKLLFRDKDTGEFEERAGVAPRAVQRWITTHKGQVMASHI